MRRFPHGGEVLGASPANPLLAPVLRPAKAMSRQMALLGLQAIQRLPGLAGYWPADPAYLFEDSGATIPASVGGVVGCWRSLGPTALQATTAVKPYLRLTPTSNISWLDSNTATSALTATLGNLGAACTISRAGAEGVTFTEGVTISSTYNIAPAFGFNGDVAIFNRALTTTEKALLTRYMQRGVPVLGNELITNGDFNSATGWTVQSGWAITGGVARATNIAGAQVYQSVGTAGRCYLITTVCNSFTSGRLRAVTNNSIYGSDRDSVGTYKDTLPTTGATIGLTSRYTGNSYDIDSFSVKELI